MEEITTSTSEPGRVPAGVIRLVVADRHPTFAHGLQALAGATTDDIAVVGIASDAQRCLELIAELSPHVAVLDPTLVEDPRTLVTAVLEADPSVSPLLLYPRPAAPSARRVLEAGARGLLTKCTSPADLFAAIRSVAAGEIVLASSTAAALVNDVSELTEDEVRLLRLFMAGEGQSEIARALLMSESTLKRKFAEVQRKLGATSRVDAVAKAVRDGLV